MFTGDLSDFSLREILQFLTSTARPGLLEVRSDASTAGIALRNGGVCLALLDLGGIRGLAARMVRGGALDVERLPGITGRSQDGAIATAIALAVEASDSETAADICREHTYETMGWLARLENAVFSFEHSEHVDQWPFAAAKLDDVLAEVEGRAERWSQLPDAVVDLALVCSPLPDVADTDVILTADQWRTIALVDGRRTVGDLVELSGIGHLETCTNLHELVESGLIELVAPGQVPTLTALLEGLGVEHVEADHAAPSRDAVRPTSAALDMLLAAPEGRAHEVLTSADDDHHLDDHHEIADHLAVGGEVGGDRTDDADDRPEIGSHRDDDADDDDVRGGPASDDGDDAGEHDGDTVADTDGGGILDEDLDGGANQALLSRLLGRKGSAP